MSFTTHYGHRLIATMAALTVPLGVFAAPASAQSAAPTPSSTSSPSPSPSCTRPIFKGWSLSHLAITAGNAPLLTATYDDGCVDEEPPRSVEVYARPAGSSDAILLASGATDSTGSFRITVRPERTTQYEARIGDSPAVCTSGHPAMVCEVRVHTRLNVTWVIDHDHAVLDVGGSLVPGGATPVGLARVVNGRYQYLSQVRSDEAGRFRMTRPIPRGRYVLIVYTPQRPGNAPGSRSVSVTV